MGSSKQAEKVPISKRALVQRINRKLAKDGGLLRGVRGGAAVDRMGEYIRIDVSRSAIVEDNVDLEALGRELGVLRAYERLAED